MDVDAVTHLFLRHPRLPDATELCYGRLDLRLPDALLQAAADTLHRHLPDLPVISSPAQRCLGLAQRLRHGAPLRCDPRLLEMDFGTWQGQPWSSIPRDALDLWSADVAGFRPPGGETFHEVVARVASLLRSLDAPHLLVTHAGVIRAALRLAGKPLEVAVAYEVPYLQAIPLRPALEHFHAG